MNRTLSTGLAVSLAFLGALVFFIPQSSFAVDSGTDTLSAILDANLVEGKVRRFDPENQTVQLQMKSGEKFTFILNSNTDFVGYDSPNEIAKGQIVKIWHSDDGDTMIAVKVEKKLMVGC